MSIIAIIPARGGSKRIPKKNIRPFSGKPIITYSIEAALQSKRFDEVMVSTDSEEIADIARKYGAEVPFMRSAETSADFSPTSDVIREVLTEYRTRGQVFDRFACIYPTAPFITGEMLSEATEMLSGSVAVVSVVRYGFPPQRAFVIRDEELRYLDPRYEKTRSQDLEPFFHDAGQFYFGHTDCFFEYLSLVPPKTTPFILDENEVQDIDTLSDWKIAELKYQALRGKEN